MPAGDRTKGNRFGEFERLGAAAAFAVKQPTMWPPLRDAAQAAQAKRIGKVLRGGLDAGDVLDQCLSVLRFMRDGRIPR